MDEEKKEEVTQEIKRAEAQKFVDDMTQDLKVVGIYFPEEPKLSYYLKTALLLAHCQKISEFTVLF